MFFVFSIKLNKARVTYLANSMDTSPVKSLHKGQQRRALMCSLICAWIKGWVNNREAVNLRRHSAYYDAIVMIDVNSVHGFYRVFIYSDWWCSNLYILHGFNTLRPKENGRHFADHICHAFIFVNENCWILIQISLKLVPRDPINTIQPHWFEYWLGAEQATSHYLSQWWIVYWRMHASLGLNELR